MKVSIHTEQENGLKALAISDLHFSGKRELKTLNWLIQLVSKKVFDVIYFVGDIIDYTNVLRDEEMMSLLFDLFSFLGSCAPVYLVYASHDQSYYSKYGWYHDEFSLKELFLNKIAGFKGIHILENQTQEIKPGYTVSGIIPSLDYAISKADGDIELLLKESTQYHFLKELEDNNVNTLLCHYPLAITDLKDKTDLLDKVNVSIAGNTHNGMTQLKVFPLEGLLNSIGQQNRGFITPGKSIKLSDTANLRGITEFSDDSKLIIIPAITSLPSCTNSLKYFNDLFYKGYLELSYENNMQKRYTK